MPSLVQNALALIGQGQWFLDSASNTLYYAPASGQQMAALDVELPQLERLLQGAGSLTAPLHDVTFSGLQFSYATWNDPSTAAGFADVQSNLRMTMAGGNQGMCTFSSPAGSCPWGSLTQPLANVSFSASNNITLSGNRFVNLGGAGLAFMYGASNNLIQGNEFTSIASTGILLGCTYDPTPTTSADAAAIKQNCTPDPTVVANDTVGVNEIMTGNTVINNVIHNIGTDYPSACGITLLFSQKTTITHNLIYDVPYTAITAGVVQGHVDLASHPEEAVNINSDNVISNNLLHDYMETLKDGAAIYIEGHQAQYVGNPVDPVATLSHGMQVTGNLAYNGHNTNYTFYDDAGSEWINWQGNAAYNSSKKSQGGCNPTGHFWITGNYIDGKVNDYSECWSQPVDVHATGNVTISGLGDVPPSILSNAGLTIGASGRINDDSKQISYLGSWIYATNRSSEGDYQNDVHYTTANNDTMMMAFTGTAIQIFGEQSADQGNIGVKIDGGPQQIVNTQSSTGRHSNVAVFTSPTLSSGQHVVIVTKLSGTYATMDGVNISP
ncbi:hypothetical protein BCY88_37235 [Paraburkholderia fungorum]|uniref:Right handed beta helix domain-containing protein n=2 Tax=Paraburkholderia fungorum TaxID=134537 RepID=A0A3R7E227_9BURK|nr:hypothetical protein BCY88_37235 [Paraburkholderia fungorum]